MQVQLEDVGSCRKLIKIEIPPEKVSEELEKTYDQLNESIVVPGFRRGHVPRWLMESRFGKQVNDDAQEALISESFDEAVKERELKPIGTPKFDEDIKLEPGKPLAFGVTIEVRPEFEIEDYTALKLEKPSVEPTEGEIAARVELIRRRYAKLEQLSEGSPKAEDVVICHATLREGDHVYRDIHNHQFIVGDHILVGLTAEETTAFVTAAKIGETIEKEITLPEGFPDEAKRGSKMLMTLKLEGIRRPVLPDVTADWAKGMGFDSLDEFRKEVESALAREKETEAKIKLDDQLSDELLKKADFDLPEDIIKSMTERALVRRSLLLRQQGAPQEEIEKHLDELRTESHDSAVREAKLYFILEKIADKERLFVTEDEIDARIESIAAGYNRSPEQVRRELEARNGLSELRSSMREDNVKAFLLEKAVIKEAKHASKKKTEPAK